MKISIRERVREKMRGRVRVRERMRARARERVRVRTRVRVRAKVRVRIGIRISLSMRVWHVCVCVRTDWHVHGLHHDSFRVIHAVDLIPQLDNRSCTKKNGIEWKEGNRMSRR